jgi:hypothetical protein
MWHGAPRITLDMLVEHVFQTDAFDKVIDKGQWTQPLNLEIEAFVANELILRCDHSGDNISARVEKVKPP